MKPLAALALLAALVLPAAAQVADLGKDPAKAGDTTELKKRYKSPRVNQGIPGPGNAVPGAGNSGSAFVPEQPGLGPVPGGGRPLLYMHYAKGPDGFTIEQLTKSLDWAEKNIGALEDYIHPYKKGEEPAKGDDLAWANKAMEKESGILASLIVDGDATLAKGIQRDVKNGLGAAVLAMYISRPSHVYQNPTADVKTAIKAGARANVAGWLASVIKLKRLNPPAAKEEAEAEGYLSDGRKRLAELEKKAE